MKILWIILAVPAALLAVLLVLLAVFLLIPARARVKWDGSLSVWAGAGPVTLRLYPRKLKKPKKPKKDKKQKQPAAAKPRTELPDDEKPKPKLKLDLNTALQYAKIGIAALGRVLKTIRISRLQLHAVIAADNPSTAALAYGGAAAAVNRVVPLIEKNVVWRNTDIFIEVDFQGKADISFDITVSTLPVVMLAAGIKLYLAFRKINKEKAVSKPLERVK